MSSQDFFNLQEAYLGVYQRETVEPDPFGRPGGKHGGVPAPGSGYDRAWKEIQKKNKENENKKNANEQIDFYDLILSHLLDEGYAETLQGAEAIMENMSEDWRESIVEGLGGAKNQGDYDDWERERQRIRDEHLRKYKSGELPFQKKKKADQAQKFLKQHPKKSK